MLNESVVQNSYHLGAFLACVENLSKVSKPRPLNNLCTERLRGLEGLAGQALSQNCHGSKRELRPRTQKEEKLLHNEASRLEGASGSGS